jgi:exopolysaccharide production protein ExoQ
MPPLLAALLTLGFIIYLFRRDFREQPNVTRALWLPTIWMLIIGSRLISQWLSLVGISWGGQSTEEGNPLDAIVFVILVLAGLRVLYRRRVILQEFIRQNPWISAFIIYCFLSILWSDYPLVAFKRWVKELGHPVMALVLLTEPDPEEALVRMMKRSAYVLLTVSVLFIKYFPEIGRLNKEWGGESPFCGITLSKNTLGCICFIMGLFFFWRLLQVWKWEKNVARRDELRLTFLFLLMDAWLLRRAHSSTSVGALGLGIMALLVLNWPRLNRQRVGTYAVVAIVFCAAMEWMFGISSLALKLLNRDPTLTGRVFIWQQAMALQPNPILGAGFESFWLGDRLKKMWDIHWWHPNEAHNGYIEIYLNLGIVGCVLLLGVLLSTFWNARRAFVANIELGRLRLAFLAALMIYNWTEAAYKAMHPAFFFLFVVAMEYPMLQQTAVQESSENLLEARDENLVAERGAV